MSNESSLKTQNAPFIIIFIAWSTTLYILFMIGFKDFWNELIQLFSKVNAKNGILITIAPLLAFILSGLLSSNLKAQIVFWKRKNPLPGSRAFSEIAPKDPRIDMEVLKKKLKKIPTDYDEQNKVWYKIYKQVESSTSVELVHKHFLLARDLASISILILILTPWSLYFEIRSIKLSFIYSLMVFTEYLTFSIISQNTAKRFVSNVLAEYCCK